MHEHHHRFPSRPHGRARSCPPLLAGRRHRTAPGRPPAKRFVAYMVLYARDVLTGELPGRYSDEDAERFAHLALADTDITAHRPRPDAHAEDSCDPAPLTCQRASRALILTRVGWRVVGQRVIEQSAQR